jgi:ParB-like chromosome segregation protein Spo0J
MSRPEPPKFTVLPHPVADIVPEMSDDEFRDLRRSIRNNGLMNGFEIVLHEGKILDGRHRYKACILEGIEPRFIQYSGIDPEEFVLAALTRREMSESQRAIAAGRLLVAQRQRVEQEKMSHKEVRQRFNLGETIVSEAARVVEHGVPELIRLVENGEVKIKQAVEIIRLPTKEQKKVVAAGAESVAAKSVQIRKTRKGNIPAEPTAAEKRFQGLTAEILRDLKMLSAKLTRYIQTSDGKRFEQYVQMQCPGWIDYSKVKLADKGEGMKRTNASFVALRPLYRLIVAGVRDRAYPAADLRQLVEQQAANELDADQPPVEPENDPQQLVEPESL